MTIITSIPNNNSRMIVSSDGSFGIGPSSFKHKEGLDVATGNLEIKVGNIIIDKGDIIMNTGDKLSERLERIENMLHIPTRDVKMEEKYAHLKELWEQYNHELDIIKMFEKLKED